VPPTYPGAHRRQPQPPQAASQQGISAARVRRRPARPQSEKGPGLPGMGIERPAHSAGLLATCGSAPKKCLRTTH
jgi:hypothetical protein